MADSGISHPTLPFEDDEPEEWRAVPGWLGYYDVSSFGNVRSLPRDTATGMHGGGILSAFPDGQGYLAVNLTRNGTRERIGVHQLVALAFIGACPEGQQVRHKDGKKHRNFASNLEYGTSLENHHDKKRHGTDPVGTRNGRAKLTDHDVRDIRSAYDNGVTQVALAAQYGLTQASVSALILRKTWRHVA
jgi:NUMOD4 motif/HNH endonuclease